MRSILRIIFILFPIVLFAQKQQTINPNGYNKFYHDNGKVSSEGPMRDGKPDGYWKTYSQNGILKSEGNRKNFQLDSVWKFFSEQGKLAFEFNYKEGKKTGVKKTFDTKDATLVLSENFENDAKQGNTIIYYKPEKLKDSTCGPVKVKQIIPFVAGKEEGQGYELSPDSTIITLTLYKMGFIQKEEKVNRKDADGVKQGMWKSFYPSGMVQNEINYSDGKMNGYFKEYAPNGSLVNTTKYINGVLQTNAPELAKLDVKTAYFETGTVKFTGTYRDGVAEGIHREFSPEGKVIAAKVYVDGYLTGEGILDTAGRQQGPWKEYHSNGELRSQGGYLNGKRIGDWVFYHPNKKIEQKGKYDKKARAQGAWKWYYETGNLLREENYRNDLQDGTMIEYSDSGSVITKGDYIDGLKEGPWILELQEYKEEGNFKADQRDGEWKHYYTENGKLRFIGKFVDGAPDGMHFYYYLSGKERQAGKYLGGLKEGEWKFYDEAGFLFLTILYKNDVEIRFDGIKVLPETSTSEPSIK